MTTNASSDVSSDSVRVALARRSRWSTVELVFWVGIVACSLFLPSKLVLLTQILITGLFAMSLDLLIGFGGIASFGHAAFFGIGAYAAGLIALHGWPEPISGLLAAGLVSGLSGLLFSFIVARASGATLFTVTLCIGLLVFEAAGRMTWLTGGESGLNGIETQPLLGFFQFDLAGQVAFAYAYAIALLLFLIARYYTNSIEGLALKAVRFNERRLAMLGISTSRRKQIAFTVSAAIAGLAGALMAQTTQIVALEALGFERSVSAIIIVVIGGLGTVIGGFAGAAIFIAMQDFLAANNPAYWNFWLGLILILLAIFAPKGVVGVFDLLSSMIRCRRP